MIPSDEISRVEALGVTDDRTQTDQSFRQTLRLRRCEEMVAEHYEHIFYFFRNRGFTREDSADLTQETFLSVYQGLEAFRGEASPRTWLQKIAKNVWLNAVRRASTGKRSGTEVPLETVPETSSSWVEVRTPPSSGSCDPQTRAIQKERVERVVEGISHLPPQMRRCIILRARGYQYGEIACLLQLAVGTVKSHLNQARRRLWEELGEELPGLDVPE